MSDIKLRIDSDLKDQLKREAKGQKRSLNNLIEVILTEFMDKVNHAEMEYLRECESKLSDDEKLDAHDSVFWQFNGDKK